MAAPADGPLGAIREAWDRVIASDPGLVRARMAISGALCTAAALAVGYGYATVQHDAAKGVLVTMMLCAVVSMMGALALPGSAARPKLVTAAFFPVAIGAGLLPGALVGARTDLMLGVFVAVMFAAVWMRRFGPAFFTYGFMVWMGYFFAAFLGADLGAVPGLVADAAVGTAVSLLLSTTLLRTHPRRTLRRVQRAFDARGRAVARACADLLEAGGDPRRTARAGRRLHARGLRLAETALMIEAWSTESGVLPDGWSGPALRHRLMRAQLAIDELAQAAGELAEQGDEKLLRPAARIAGHLARREYPAVLYAAHPLLADSDRGLFDLRGEERAPAEDATTPEAARAFGLLAALEGLDTPQDPAAGRLARAAVDFVVLETEADDPPEADAAAVDFVPAVALTLGMLPGSAAVAGNVEARGRWNPLRRARLTTRQAVQVALAGALAIVLGRQISETRYYWAVIASFVTFAGTATRSETSIKAVNRVLGTLVGLGLAIGLAELTAGDTPLMLTVIVLSMMCGFYVVNVSYAGMILFVTIMVAQLYSALHEFTPGFLVLRLEETSLGAAIGIAVGLFVLPTSTRDTVAAAERGFLGALAAVLDATADAWDGEPADPAGLVRAMEDRLRQLALTARPLTRPLMTGDPTAMRRRLARHAAAARRARALAALRVPAPVLRAADGAAAAPGAGEPAAVAAACRALARTLAGATPS